MPRSRRRLLAGLAGTIGIVGSVGLRHADESPANVESFQYDAANTGTTVATTGPGPEVTERWRADVWRAEDTSPVLVDDTVICAGYRRVGAFDRFDGTERWRTSLNELVLEVGGSPAVEDGRVFVPTWNGPNEMNGIHALDVETGTQLWHARAGENVQGSLTAVDGVVYSGSTAGVTGRENGRLVALEAATGDELWDVTVNDHVTTPAVVDGVVYAGIDGDAYAAFEAETGEELWRYEVDIRARTAPTVADGTVYVGVHDPAERLHQDDKGMVRALEAVNGAERWQLTVGEDVSHSVAVDETTAYVTSPGDGDTGFVAVDTHDREIRWTSPGDVFDTAPVVVGNAVYVGRGTDVVALETEDGTERWSVSIESTVRNTPVVADGIVYAQTVGENLYAFETA